MMSKKIVFLASLLVMGLSAVTAAAASANGGWEFNGTELTGTEAVLGVSIASTLSVPGAPVSCEHLQLFMKISNTVAPGDGEVTKLLPYECTATATCTVQSIQAEKLPWPAHTATFVGKNYIIIEKVHIDVEFGGALCAFAEVPIAIKGTAGGLFENATSTLTLNKASFETTGASLKAGASTVQWTGVFPMEALGVHSSEALGIG